MLRPILLFISSRTGPVTSLCGTRGWQKYQPRPSVMVSSHAPRDDHVRQTLDGRPADVNPFGHNQKVRKRRLAFELRLDSGFFRHCSVEQKWQHPIAIVQALKKTRRTPHGWRLSLTTCEVPIGGDSGPDEQRLPKTCDGKNRFVVALSILSNDYRVMPT